MAKRTARLKKTCIDLDIDSDNNNAFNAPARSDEEEDIQDDPSLPGKIIAVNNQDIDDDGVPDYADSEITGGQSSLWFFSLRVCPTQRWT